MAEDTRIIRVIYSFFLGVLLAIFVGVGVNTFYPGPTAPEYPSESISYTAKEPTAEQIAAEKQYNEQWEQHQKDMQPYNRNVSIITLVAAVTLLAISLVYERRIKFIADGVMLGGLFTLLYSLGRSFASDNSKYIFTVVSVALIVVLFLGYHRFVRPFAGAQVSAELKPQKQKSSKK